MHPAKNIVMLALFLLTSGCASLFSGSQQEMHVNSEPEGADVYVDGLHRGKTPVTLKLTKDEFKNITVRKQGYHEEAITLNTKFDPVGLLNLFSSAGFTIDAFTGAMFEYSPGKFHVRLKAAGQRKVSDLSYARDYPGELEAFIMRNFYRIKSQCHVKCDDTYFATLGMLIAGRYEIDNKTAMRHAEAELAGSGQPFEFLKNIDSRIATASRRVVTIKGGL